MNPTEEIKQRLDIVEFINSHVPLQKAGRNYKGLCPFHPEKTPSFIVFPETQGWHCFGACSTGGDIFTFVMRRENMDFSEALHFLAEKAGVVLHPLDVDEIQQKDELDRLRAANAAAAQHYYHVLMEAAQGEPARKYLEKRGVTRESMAAFQLGYATDEWHILEEVLKRAHFSPQDILTAGLAVRSDSGNVYDRFRGRLMFPIRDIQGHVIGFGGRVLDAAMPKYMNTPDTPLFDKGSVLYGIDLARESIRSSGTVIIVEGYMDVIIPHQYGVTNVVACMGTALTEAHLRILKRMTKRLILALDPDTAGMHAVEKGVETAQQSLDRRVIPVPTATGLIRYEEQLAAEIRILMLPEGLDPDELISRDRARWDQLVAEALPVADYFFQVVLSETDLSSAKGKRQAMERLLPVIAAMGSPAERTHYLQRLAQRLRLDERELLPELERLRGSGEAKATKERGRRTAGQSATAPAAHSQHSVPAASEQPEEVVFGLEERCLALLLQTPALLAEMTEIASLSGEAFQDVRNRQVFEALGSFVATQPQYEMADFCAGLDNALSAHVESLLQALRAGPPLSPEMVREDLLKCSTRLRKSYLLRLIRELRFVQQDAQEEGAAERVLELCGMIDQLTRHCLEIDRRAYAATLIGRRQSKEKAAKTTGTQDAL